ncbi:hypothetical protein M422DRAFT_778466 [Sphaerobolus stellatus SS14]|nr:hypothetical protein M422DRAFT_778466 [Sphaerobolus stellatus SS14]
MPKSLVRIKGSIQNYDWGKEGSKSLVAQLAPQAIGPEFKLEKNKAYAEVWMGTHPNGAAHLYSDPSKLLSELLASSPQFYVGSTIISKFPKTSTDKSSKEAPELPFLFKILSIAKALPLQAHPDKHLAETLYTEDKSHQSFIDTNHKPEIALALGDFRGFVGFKPLEDIHKQIGANPELKEALTGSTSYPPSNSGSSLKSIMSSLLKRPQDEITPLVNALVERTKSSDDPLHKLVQQVNSQYPGDVGVFIAPFLMNLAILKKGEAIYIPADDAHAYLDGDIIECMAISDNVVNAAFVPPEDRDPDTFIDMLTYTSQPLDYFDLKGKPYQHGLKKATVAYDPPLEEFTVLWTKLDGETKSEILEPVKGPTVGILVEGTIEIGVDGEKETFERGACFFVAAEKRIEVRVAGNAKAAEVFWSTVNFTPLK